MTLYQSGDCSGPPESQGSAADFASPGLAGGVDDNTTSQFSAIATTPPATPPPARRPSPHGRELDAPAPTITASVPGSPSSDNYPLLKGTAPAGSTVTLYQSGDCSGPPESQGSAADFASPGLAGGVDDNTTSQFSAIATDAAGNTSACSAPFTYVENSSPPAAPTITASVPGSPSSDNYPLLKGTAPAGSTVTLYQSGDCSGPPESQGSAADFASPGLAGGVDDNTTSQFFGHRHRRRRQHLRLLGALHLRRELEPPRRPDDHRLGPGQPLERQLPTA